MCCLLIFQGTPYNPYAKRFGSVYRNKYRAIGINRTDRYLRSRPPCMPEEFQVIQWVALPPMYLMYWCHFIISKTLEGRQITAQRSPHAGNFYWSSRLCFLAMADAAYAKTSIYIERYRLAVGSKAHELIIKGDKAQKESCFTRGREKIVKRSMKKWQPC